MRKPKEYQALEPGDIVQIDTLDVRPLPDTVLKHFTARDVISRWDVLEVHTRATSALAAGFLNSLRQRLPFPLKAVQALRPATPLPQAQRPRGTGPAYPHRGVL